MQENQSSGFPTRIDINWSVQPQKKASSFKFWVLVEEESYYPCSENKGAGQLCNYCTADLCLCFLICRLLAFPCSSSVKITHSKILSKILNT